MATMVTTNCIFCDNEVTTAHELDDDFILLSKPGKRVRAAHKMCYVIFQMQRAQVDDIERGDEDPEEEIQG